MRLPGHSAYLAGLFNLRKVQWKNRQLFASSAFSMLEVELNYFDNTNDNFLIRVETTGITMAGVQNKDSLNIRNIKQYLALFETFYTNEYIDIGQVPKYDSLLKTNPIAVIRVKDMYKHASKEIEIYSIPQDKYYVLKENNNDISICEKKRFQKFLIRNKQRLY